MHTTPPHSTGRRASPFRPPNATLSPVQLRLDYGQSAGQLGRSVVEGVDVPAVIERLCPEDGAAIVLKERGVTGSLVVLYYRA